MRRLTNRPVRTPFGFASLRAPWPRRLRSTPWIAALALGGAFALACGGDEPAGASEASQSPDELAASLLEMELERVEAGICACCGEPACPDH